VIKPRRPSGSQGVKAAEARRAASKASKARPARRNTADASTRESLLDAAEALLLEEGYASVTSRRVAERAGTNAALVYYYFDSMDGLFVELFRRNAERGLERQASALISPQPLWALWDLLNDHMNNVRTLEFFALANHRKAIQAEVVEYSARYRAMQLEILSRVLDGYGLDVETWPPVTVILTMGSLSLLLLIERGLGFEMGHAEMIGAIERQIRELEGDRWTGHPALARRGN
jgi:AcrR family transcriptional regulator